MDATSPNVEVDAASDAKSSYTGREDKLYCFKSVDLLLIAFFQVYL